MTRAAEITAAVTTPARERPTTLDMPAPKRGSAPHLIPGRMPMG
jgi:hypothetical protein